MKEKLKAVIKKITIPAITSLAILLVTVICYLAVSFITSKWDISWLIIVGGVFLSVIVSICFLITSLAKKGKYIIPRIGIAIMIVLVFTFVFLAVLMLTEITKVWILFLIMAIAIVGADTVFAYWTDAKTRVLSLIIFIQVSTALEYVILALVGILSWHPYWFIPVIGAVINMVIIGFKLKFIFIKPKKTEQIEK